MDFDFEKATNDITYDMIEGMEASDIINHTDDFHLYKYEVDCGCCDDDDGIIVLKDNVTDEELCVVLMDTEKRTLVFEDC